MNTVRVVCTGAVAVALGAGLTAWMLASDMAPPPRYAALTRTLTADGAGMLTNGAEFQNRGGTANAGTPFFAFLHR